MSGRVQVVIALSAMDALGCTSTGASSVGVGLRERYPRLFNATFDPVAAGLGMTFRRG